MGGEQSAPRDEKTLKLGQLALDRGLISADQLYEALEEQTRRAAGGASSSLPQILVEKGYIKDHQVELLSEERKTSILGKYTLVNELGRGGMGIVYEALDRELNRKVALKTLLLSPNADAQESQAEEDRFLREAKLTARLPKHPNIVGVYEAGIIEGKRYLAMELIEGRSFGKWRKAGSPPIRRQVEILRDVALAVHHAHQQGVVHRDLKPENILLDGREQPHVSDFGLAKSVAQDVSLSLTATGTVIGTPSYMSPEQALGLKSADHRIDIYAMGVMLYEILTGQQPFTGETAIEILLKASKNPVPPPSSILKAGLGIDKTLESICLKCLAKKPDDRYLTADSLATDLTRWLKGDSVHVQLPPTEELAIRKSPVGILIAAGVGLALAIGVAVFFKSQLDQARQALKPEVGLAAAERVHRVVEKLKERNPGFDGTATHRIEGNRVTRLSFSTAAVRDLSPLRELPELEQLEVKGVLDEKSRQPAGALADLSPLKGLGLKFLDCSRNDVEDLAPLAGMPLEELTVSENRRIRDLSPVRGMPLQRLRCMTTEVSDLRPVSALPLVLLYVDDTPLADLSPIQGMQLADLDIAFTKVADLSPVRGMPLERLSLNRSRVSDLSPIVGMTLTAIHVKGAPVKDLSVLRSIRTLTTIDGVPVAEFWKSMGLPVDEFGVGLVAHWKLNEGFGTTVADYSGNGRTGTLVNGARWVGNVLQFDGVNSYVEISDSAALDRLRTGSWTVSLWYRPDYLPAGKGEENNAGYRLIGWSWGGLSYLPSDEFMPQYRAPGNASVGIASGLEVHPAGQWHHVVGVVDQSTRSIIPYVNGKSLRKGAFGGKEGPEPPAAPWRIGILNPGAAAWRWAAKGAIDSVRVYDRALTAEEVERLRASEAPAHGR